MPVLSFSTLSSSLSWACLDYNIFLQCLKHDSSSGPAWAPPLTLSCCLWQHLGKLIIRSTCFSSPFRYIFAFTFGGHASIQWSHLSCFLFEFSLETTPQIFHTASNWLTLALAVQRYIYVCNPALAKQCCTIGYARMLVMCLVGFAVMHMIPMTLDRL